MNQLALSGTISSCKSKLVSALLWTNNIDSKLLQTYFLAFLFFAFLLLLVDIHTVCRNLYICDKIRLANVSALLMRTIVLHIQYTVYKGFNSLKTLYMCLVNYLKV